MSLCPSLVAWSSFHDHVEIVMHIVSSTVANAADPREALPRSALIVRFAASHMEETLLGALLCNMALAAKFGDRCLLGIEESQSKKDGLPQYKKVDIYLEMGNCRLWRHV